MASKDKSNVKVCGTENGGTSDHAGSAVMPIAKVKFTYKVINFICAAYALSWFFEGWREVAKSPSITNAAILVAGTLFTVLFLGVHAYWVYIEEKSKGTLKKRIELFEKIYLALQAKRESGVVVTEKGEN